MFAAFQLKCKKEISPTAMLIMAAASVMEAYAFRPFAQKRNACRTHAKIQSTKMTPSGIFEAPVLISMSQALIAIIPIKERTMRCDVFPWFL
jgi:hypothetical protein